MPFARLRIPVTVAPALPFRVIPEALSTVRSLKVVADDPARFCADAPLKVTDPLAYRKVPSLVK